MISPRLSFQKDGKALECLREVLAAPWFERAVHAALLSHHQNAKTTDEIHGAAAFVQALANLAEDEPPKRKKISSGLKHESLENYGRSHRPKPTSQEPGPEASARKA